MTFVIDASVVAELLLGTERGLAAAQLLENHALVAPQHLAAEPSMTLSRQPGMSSTGDVEWHEWVPVDQYGVAAVMYPSFFADELGNIGTTPKWITTRQ